MATLITRTDIRGEMLRRAPILGRRLTADSITKAGPSLTQVSEYERQRAGLTSFEGEYINRYNFTNTDRWRLITALNSGANDGVINVDGPAYLDNSDLAYERLTVHPDDLNFAIAEGQRRQRVRTNIALVRGHDMDCEMTGTNYWGTAVALGSSTQLGVTLSKITSPQDVHSGTQALLYQATAPTNYARGEVFSVSPNRQTYVACIVRVLTGTMNFQLRDFTSGLYFGTGITLGITGTGGSPSGGWVLCVIQVATPTATNLMQVEFSGTDATALFEVDTCFGPYQAGQTQYLLQSAFNEAYKLRFVRPSKCLYPLSLANTFDAESVEFIGDLVSPVDWNAEIFRRDANSNRLRFNSNSYNNRSVGWGLPSNSSFMSQNMGPIWLAMEAQVSDFEPVLLEASTTSQPLDECACYSLRYLAETMLERDPGNPVWTNMLQEYKSWAVIEDMARPPQAMLPQPRIHLWTA